MGASLADPGAPLPDEEAVAQGVGGVEDELVASGDVGGAADLGHDGVVGADGRRARPHGR